MPRHDKKQFSRDRREQKIPPCEVLFRRFKRDVERSGKLKDLKRKEFHETRGERNRRKAKEGMRRHQKASRDKFMEQFPNGNLPKPIRNKRKFG